MNDYPVSSILLVEDNERDAELTMRALRKQNLLDNVVWVEDGVEALDFVFCRKKYAVRSKGQNPKVILLDLKLPKLNGLEVLKALREDPSSKQIPVVMLTSSNEDPDIKTAYQFGANSYVTKPVDFDAFLNAVANLGIYWLLVNQPPT